MTDELVGEFRIKGYGFEIVPDSLRSGDVKRLTREIAHIRKVNPNAGVVWLLNIAGASGCKAHINDSSTYAKCLVNMRKL